MPGVTLYSPDGSPVTITPAEAQAGIAAGKLLPQKDQEIHVRLKDGRVGTVPGSSVHEALADQATIIDPAAEEADSAKGAARSFAVGALQGATGGLGAGILRKGIGALSPSAGRSFQDTVETDREVNPIASTAGNVAGMVAPALLSGGASAAAGGAARAGVAGAVRAGASAAARATPAALIDAVGTGAEHIAGRALAGLGESTAARVAQTAGKLATRAGVENSIYAVTDKIGEDMLGNHELAGEKALMATGLHGLVTGAAVGGGLGVAGSALRIGGKATARGVRSLLNGEADKLAAQAETKVTEATAALEAAQKNAGLGAPSHTVGMDVAEDLSAPTAKRAIGISPAEHGSMGVSYTAGIGEETSDILGRRMGIVDAAPAPFDIGPAGSVTAENSHNPFFSSRQFAKQHDVRVGPMAEYAGTAPESASTDIFGLKSGHDVKLKGGLEDLSPMPSEAPFKFAANPEALKAQKELEAAQKTLAQAEEMRALAKEHAGAGSIHGLAADQAFRTLGVTKKAAEKINATIPGGTRALGDTLLKEGIIDSEGGVMKALGEGSAEQIRDRVSGKLSTVGKDIGSLVSGSQASVTVSDIVKTVDEVAARLNKNAGSMGAARGVDAYKKDLLTSMGALGQDGQLLLDKSIPFADFVGQRRSLQDLAYKESKALDPGMRVEALRDVSRAFRSMEDEALDRAAASAGGGAESAKFRELNRRFQHLTLAEEALEKTIAGETANRAHSLPDHLVGHGSAMVGSAIGGAVLPVVGHGIGAVVSGGIGAGLNKLLRTRGNAAAAVGLKKLADLGTVKSLIGSVDTAVDGAARGLTSSDRAATARAAGRSKEPLASLGSRYRDAVADLHKLQDAGQQAMLHSEDLAVHAPNTAQAFTVAAARVASFLQSKVPAPLESTSPFTTYAPSVPDTEKATYLRYDRYAKHPMTILEDFEKGVITPEGAETLKVGYPGTYKEVQDKVLEMVAQAQGSGKPLSFKKRVALGLLFEVPTDASFEPDVYKALQSNVAAPPPPSGGGKGKSKGGSLAPPRMVKLPVADNPLDRLASFGAGRHK